MSGRMVEEVLCTARGTELYTAAHFHPRPRAIAVVAHSLTERLTDCEALVQALLRAGFSVYLYDWRHQPCGTVPDVQRRPRWPSARKALEDFALVVEHATAREAEKSTFIVAHNEGAAVCVTYCATHAASKVAGVVLCTPTGEVPIAGRWSAWWSALLCSCIWPRRHVTVIRDGEPQRMELRFYRLSFQLARDAMNKAAQMKTPMLMVCGTRDAPEDAAACEKLLDQANSIDKSLAEIDGNVEDLWSEEAKDNVQGLQKIVEWLSERA